MPQPTPAFEPISALPRLRELLDGAQDILKTDISRIKKLLADPDALLPPELVAFTLQEAKDALELLRHHAQQLTHWQKEPITDAERSEVARLQSLIPEIRPLVQRLIALSTELDRRATSGTATPRKRWRH
jgi:hypothetical protein